MIKFFLLVTNRGQPRIRKYYDYPDEEIQFETELIKKCLTRNEHLVRMSTHLSAGRQNMCRLCLGYC